MNKKIIMTVGEWSEMVSGIGDIPDDADYKDIITFYYKTLMDWAHSHGRLDIVKACPNAWYCPLSFDDFWENILYVEFLDD